MPGNGDHEPYWSRELSRACFGCNVVSWIITLILIWLLVQGIQCISAVGGGTQ
ncbi:MAG: hypothetical protein AB7Y46_08705 [Armatimonadota bacterium]